MSIKKVKNIIFDADDTLWENNIYYVRAAEDLVNLLHESGKIQSKIENDFQALEHEVVRTMGYGSQNYIYILKTLFHRYKNDLNDPSHPERLKDICETFSEHVKIQPRIFPRVEETLSELKDRYPLYVLTKGDIQEQWGKLERSNLLPYFEKTFVKSEKDFETYQKILTNNKWNPSETCMIGNSPKSDINPALKAGLWAIYIPYEHTWVLDDEAILPNQQNLYTVSSFPDILSILY